MRLNRQQAMTGRAVLIISRRVPCSAETITHNPANEVIFAQIEVEVVSVDGEVTTTIQTVNRILKISSPMVIHPNHPMDIRFDRAQALTVHHFNHRHSITNIRRLLQEVGVVVLDRSRYPITLCMVDFLQVAVRSHNTSVLSRHHNLCLTTHLNNP